MKLIITIVVTAAAAVAVATVVRCRLLYLTDTFICFFFFAKMTLSHRESIVIRFSNFFVGWHHLQGLAH